MQHSVKLLRSVRHASRLGLRAPPAVSRSIIGADPGEGGNPVLHAAPHPRGRRAAGFNDDNWCADALAEQMYLPSTERDHAARKRSFARLRKSRGTERQDEEHYSEG